MTYYRLSKGKFNYKLFPVSTDPYSHISTLDTAWYISMFLYNEEHYAQWQNTGSIAGIKDNITKNLWWDFDNEKDLEVARTAALNVVNKLLEEYKVPLNCIQMAFSGNKGFGIIVNIDKDLTASQVASFCRNIVPNNTSFDEQMYDNQRLFRLAGTKHEITGLYKTPLSYQQLAKLSIATIKDAAISQPKLRLDYKTWNIPTNLIPANIVKPPIIKSEVNEIDWSKKPKFLTNCRYALQQGDFNEGIRSYALLCLASTYKNLGFELDHVFRLLKGVAEIQSKRHNTERFPDNEIWNNICVQVFNDTWNNGQYSCKNDGWLKTYCEALGDHSCNNERKRTIEPITIVDLAPEFREFAKNIDKNTIKTGIDFLDQNLPITTGMNCGILGSPGSGKTSIALEILSNTSKNNVRAIFASLDMARTRIFEKILYRVTGKPRNNLYEAFKNGEDKILLDTLQKEFGKVGFFKKSVPTVSDLKDYILSTEEKYGEKVKLVVIDYFERIMSEYSDETQGSKRIAGELQDLIDDMGIALITLVQPTKDGLNGGINKPLYDFTKIKGSSFLSQSFRGIISCWRPGYIPNDVSNDKFLKMAILKNDLGELGEKAFHWDGRRGMIRNMNDMEQQELEELERRLKEEQEHSPPKNDW